MSTMETLSRHCENKIFIIYIRRLHASKAPTERLKCTFQSSHERANFIHKQLQILGRGAPWRHRLDGLIPQFGSFLPHHPSLFTLKQLLHHSGNFICLDDRVGTHGEIQGGFCFVNEKPAQGKNTVNLLEKNGKFSNNKICF